MSAELWDLFVEDAGELVRRLRAGANAADAQALAVGALAMGVVEVGLLAGALARALEAGDDAARVAPAIAALEAAVAALASPDASGARVDAAPLVAAREALEAPAAHVETTGGVWTPAVPDDMLELFFEEAHERLEGLAQKLIALEGRPDSPELVRDVFRDLHTLKGSSAMVGLTAMNRLAHSAEDLVGQLRDGKRAADRASIDVLLAALDSLRVLVERAAARAPLDVDVEPLLARLRAPHLAVAAAAPTLAVEAAPVQTLAPAAAAARHTIRVDFDKLDLLLNLIGELVLGKTAVATAIGGLASLGREIETNRRLARRGALKLRVGGPTQRPGLAEELGRVERVFRELAHELETSSGRLDRVAGDLRDQVMKLRMIPIAGVFRKHQRSARDLAHQLGKQVRLELLGEDTELDKVLVEQLDDPLLHLVRNAIDHGLETPAERAAAGKPPEGTLRLSASHRGNQIVIVIRDDGRGIDPVKLRARALEKGLLSAQELESLDDRQALEIIFRPGFSTAAKVSDLSGRGVGLDVVREAIVGRLKGTIDLASEVGKGTTFTLVLPLTLAIIQVLLLRAAGEVLAIPLDIVRRTLTVSPDALHRVHDREVLAIRERAAGRHSGAPAETRQVPVVRLREALELDGDSDEGEGLVHVILVETQGGTFGLLCDRLLGKQEVVIKSLGELLGDVPCAAGATLLGDRPALILDVPAVVARGAAGERRPPPAHGSTPPAAPRHRRILLVEDSETARAAMQRSLEGAGYEVTGARDGAEALAIAARAAPFDLVSTDIMMPNVDGYELCRALRADARYRDVPIVMVTSRGEKIDRVRGFDAGVDEYLTKPHDRQQYLDAVARHLERHKP